MDQELTFRVLFQGLERGDNTLEEIKMGVKEAFDLDDNTLEQVFSGKPVVIKPHADEATAKQFTKAIMALGGVSWFEPRGGSRYADRREVAERREGIERRDTTRSSAIAPDRRQTKGRRHEDSST